MRAPIALVLCLCAAPVRAAPPEIVSAGAARSGERWDISVTLTHPDIGWDHYADGWRVESEDGTVLGVRELFHPHETEQPFTRSLSGVAIPEGTARVYIRARCLTDGWTDGRRALKLE